MKKQNSTAKEIQSIDVKLISVPWNGVPVFIKARTLTPLAIRAIANISMISVDKTIVTYSWRVLAHEAEMQHKIVQAVLVSPTYEELMKVAQLGSFDKTIADDIKKLTRDILSLEEGPEKKEFLEQLSAARFLTDFILPNDFTAKIVEFALQKNETEIDLVTKDILMNCIVLQSKQGGRYSDYCDGILSAFNKLDIDERCTVMHHELMNKKKVSA